MAWCTSLCKLKPQLPWSLVPGPGAGEVSGHMKLPPLQHQHFLVLRKNDSFNDFKIILSDGIVLANSAIMSSASDYFATKLSSDKFVEGETKEVPMKEYGMKKAMEWMVLYIYYGQR